MTKLEEFILTFGGASALHYFETHRNYPSCSLASAFYWADTPQGDSFWRNLDYLYDNQPEVTKLGNKRI